MIKRFMGSKIKRGFDTFVAAQSSTLELNSTNGLPLNYLCINGNTQDGKNANEDSILLELTGKNILNPDIFFKTGYGGVNSTPTGEGVKITGVSNMSVYVNLLERRADTPVQIPKSLAGKELTFFSYGNETNVEMGFYEENNTGGYTMKKSATLTTKSRKSTVKLTTETHWWMRVRYTASVEYDYEIKFMCVEGDFTNQDLEYERYVCSSRVEIPSKITLNESELPLALAGQGDICDTLEISRITNKVEYTKRLEGEQLLEEEQVYDITKTSLGRALLELKTLDEGNTRLRALSSVGASKLLCSYYSSVDESHATITLAYVCNGKEIMQKKEYRVRYGSAYKIIAPSISGYKPKKPELMGAIKGDCEIIIEYTKK